jgi:hypothetical protein
VHLRQPGGLGDSVDHDHRDVAIAVHFRALPEALRRPYRERMQAQRVPQQFRAVVAVTGEVEPERVPDSSSRLMVSALASCSAPSAVIR